MSDDLLPIPPTEPVAPAKDDGQRAHSSRSFFGAAKLISLFTFLSRLLGMAREAIAAHFFGAGVVWSAFTVAFTIPNLFRKLLGEGALSAAFIPLYAHELKHSTPDAARDFATASVNLLVTILIGLTIVGELILLAVALAWPDMRFDRMLMLKLTAVMLPYVMLVCGAAFLGAILQVHRRFGVFAAIPVILNLCHIAVIGIGAWVLGLSGKANPDDASVQALQITLSYWLAAFVLVAGVLQVSVLVPSLRAVGFRFRWVRHFWTPMVRRMLVLSGPVALGAGVLQLSVLLDRGISFLLMEYHHPVTGEMITRFEVFGHWFRYPMAEGAPARLAWAQFLYQFPLGVFAIALATAIFPGLSAHAMDPDKTQFKSTLRHGIEMTLLEGLPASVGLIIVRVPAVQLLFQHGQFRGPDTDWVALSVAFYSAAIWAFSLQQILNRAYYAMRDMVTPLILSAVTLAVNLAVEIPLIWTPLGEAGMAAGTSVSFGLQALLMLYLLDRRVGGLELGRIVPNVLKMLLATALMFVACWSVQRVPGYPHNPDGKKLGSAIQLALLMGVGGGVYFGVCAVTGVTVLQELIPRRFRRKQRVEPQMNADERR